MLMNIASLNVSLFRKLFPPICSWATLASAYEESGVRRMLRFPLVALKSIVFIFLESSLFVSKMKYSKRTLGDLEPSTENDRSYLWMSLPNVCDRSLVTYRLKSRKHCHIFLRCSTLCTVRCVVPLHGNVAISETASDNP